MDKFQEHFDEIYKLINDINITKLKKLKIICSLEEVREKIERKLTKYEKEKINIEYLYS